MIISNDADNGNDNNNNVDGVSDNNNNGSNMMDLLVDRLAANNSNDQWRLSRDVCDVACSYNNNKATTSSPLLARRLRYVKV